MFKKSLCSLFTLAGASILFALPPHLGNKTFQSSSINAFDFDLSWENVRIEPTTGNDISVDIYCNKKSIAPSVKHSAKTLIIKTTPDLRLSFFRGKKLCTVIVKVPANKKFDEFNIHTSSGNIYGSLSFSAEEVHLEASSGNISMEGQIVSKDEIVIETSSGDSFVNYVQTTDLSATASSGNVTIENAVSKNASINTTSGNIIINGGSSTKTVMEASSGYIKCNNYSAETSVFETTSGNIKLQNLTSNKFKGSASSGNIIAENFDCKGFEISTSSGTIGLDFSSYPVSNSSVKSSSGTQYISMPKNSSITLQVSTSSGSFTNTFTNEKLASHVDYNNKINGGGAKVSFIASSGNITLDTGDGVASGKSIIFDDDDKDIPVVIFNDEK